jgi:hypothetical protein
MCEYYLDSCEEPECYEAADLDNRYQMRSGEKLTLWRGYGEPCKHILEKHGPDCDIRKPNIQNDGYGDYDEREDCNCYKENGAWAYA